jgi:dTDP-4-amino-4,6-dideoxygalactose transaminase
MSDRNYDEHGAPGQACLIQTRDAEIRARPASIWLETQETGFNSLLDSLQSAILNAKLPRLDADNARRAVITRRYQRGLADLPILNAPSCRPAACL